MAYEPGIAIAAAIDFARGLMGWKQFAGTWASLDAGWGMPSKMSDPLRLAKSAARLDRIGKELGFAPGFANEEVPRLPARGQAQLISLAKTAAVMYRGVQ